MQTQPCRIYIHPTLIGHQDKIDAVVAQTGLAVVVGTNRAALSLVEPKATNRVTMQIRLPPGFALFLEALEEAARLRDQVLEDIFNKPRDTDPDPFNSGGRAA